MGDKNQQLKKRIIKNLYDDSTLSSAELSLKVDKSLPLINRVVGDLLEEGMVVETGYAPSTGGRRPITYSLAKNVLFVISVAMDQFVTRIAVMDMSNTPVTPEVKFEMAIAHHPDPVAFLVQQIAGVIKESGIEKNKFAGVGIGMPGFIDLKKGVNYSFLKTTGKSLKEYIREAIELPVYIDNDSSVIALAELKFGAARGKKNAMVINAGWGVGLGMILNGELFRGNNGFAGEFSHLPIFNNNKLCFCGKTGCLETEASLLVVVEKAQEGIKAGRLSKLKQLPIEHSEEASQRVITAAHEGDQFAIELLSDAGYKIGRGVAILIHLMNPEIVILSGRGSFAGKIWNAPIQQAINEHCIPRLAVNTSVAISELGYSAELIGAAALVMEHFEKQGVLNNQVSEKELKTL